MVVTLVSHSPPADGIHLTEFNATLSVEGNDFGSGTLYISESCVLWLNAAGQGVQLAYKMICLHAISRDLTSFPHEHLLLHYEGSLPGGSSSSYINGTNEQGTDQSHSEEDDDGGHTHGLQDYEGTITEIRFVPENKDALDGMFQAMSDCQTLHPDEDCQLSDEEEFEDAEEHEELYPGEEGIPPNLSAEGRANLQRMNILIERGQGDGDLISRTSDIQISNGHHDGSRSDTDQFQDADNMEQ